MAKYIKSTLSEAKHIHKLVELVNKEILGPECAVAFVFLVDV